MDLDMGEVKLWAHLLCSLHNCQGKNAYICGNNNFFAFPGSSFLSNNHTKIDENLTRGKVFLTTVRAVYWCHSEPVVEA
jgi:hypothetical protein